MSIETFFGRKAETFENRVQEITRRVSKASFAQLKQVHGNACLFRGDGEGKPEADGHWTTTPGVVLFIATADCMPIMIHDPVNRRIAALHAGWRGVARRIVPALLDQWRNDARTTWHPAKLQFFVGPHIQKDSFEVGMDVQKELYDSISIEAKRTHSLPSVSNVVGDKAYVNLGNLVRAQAEESGCNWQQWTLSKEDTKTTTDLASYRRDGTGAGRNWSGIYLAPT